MGVISSTLKMIDGSSGIISKNIGIMTKMIDTMEMMNRAGDMPGLDDAFNEIRQEISVADRELEEFRKNMQETGDEGQRASSKVGGGFSAIQKIIIAANQGVQLLKQGYQSLRSFMNGADERTSADARLNIIRDELRTQEQLEAQVMAVANATRTSYETTAELVAKMGRQDYFRGQNDNALAFAKTLNQGLIVSGASASEANGTITQLTQGLASGVLRGDEFNSIMENGSVLAEMMATSLGVTKGELRAMAADGMLTTDVVVSSIMQQAAAIDEQFNSMPATFGQVQTQMSNVWSQILNDLSQTGQPIDTIIVKMQEVYVWLKTMEGQRFMTSLGNGIALVLDGTILLAQFIAGIYNFFSDNWANIEPILLGIAIAVGGLTTAYGIYNGILFSSKAIELGLAVAQAVKTKATLASTSATAAATAAQWGLNAALLANPITWVVIAVVALIAAFVALSIWLYKLWQTNIDFRVGVISVWNNLLGFFDQVPIFFQMVSNGILDAFSHMQAGIAMILQNMVNNAISNINQLIDLVNKIPGVSIGAVSAVEFGTNFAIEEEARRQARADALQTNRDNADAKAAEREARLLQDADRWRSEAAEKEAALQAEQKEKNRFTDSPFLTEPSFDNVKLSGGELDKVGKIESEVDISNQSLAYMRDIAELQALESVNAYNTIAYEGFSETRLSDEDANLLKNNSNFNTNIYYLNYSGGVRINSSVNQGDDWDSIKQQLLDETDAKVESGLDGLYDEVIAG